MSRDRRGSPKVSEGMNRFRPQLSDEAYVQLWLDYCELKDALHTIGYTPYNAKTMKRIARAALGESE